ncbi:chondroadherin-like b isoform X1 [Syngnathus typhle]|uniref:chondroadherin-like b isoform X1 n=2 Tax=Syngnathus typhle TaxID=161592 RepID=UPI002A6A65F0|nr:chondroadherin-like b isoform X1 [Syngnathus typhle]
MKMPTLIHKVLMYSPLSPDKVWVPLLSFTLLFLLVAQAAKCPEQCVCDQIQLAVTCVNKNLTEIPPTVDEITVKFDLRGNDIQELPTGAFQKTPYLTHLSLQRCNIRRVKEGAFRGLGRLVFLNLASNHIDILYQESFDGLSSLKQLMIDRNRVEEIQPGAFSQLGFLNLLSLTHNHLVYIPNMAFQGLLNIKWLRLSHNSLNYLDIEAFAGLFTLNRLSLDHNELQFFPTETMTRLPEVTRLDLSYNPMTYLGEESVSMAKLSHLFLDHMSLQDLANTAISKSPNLIHLDLSHNQLRVMQPFSDGTPKLARLHLAGNPIYCNCYMRPLRYQQASLSTQISVDSTRLVFSLCYREWAIRSKVKLIGTCAGPLHLSGEILEAVHPPELRCQSQEAMLKAEFEEASRRAPPPTEAPENKAKCPANCACEAEAYHSSCENRGHSKIPRGFSPDTRLLDLRGNNFHYVPSNSFPAVSQVVSLHLQRCKIVEVEDGAFNGMKGLIYLYLSENLISSLRPEAFKGLPQLTYLHLEKNNFTIFPKAAFKLLPGLLALHLENNSISKLEANALDGTKSLRALYLTGNAVDHVSPKALEHVPDLDTLHLAGNKLKEVPTEALSKLGNMKDLRLSGNAIRWVGPNAFQPLGKSLKELYLDNMALEKMSQSSLAGLGPGLRSLFLEGNHLEEVPDLRQFTSLEVINLADNPLMCDCPLLPLRLWIEKVNLKVRATCANPPELRGRRVKDVHVFKACPGGDSLPSVPSVATKRSKTPKATKPKPMHLSSRVKQGKMHKSKSNLRKNPKTKGAKKTKRLSMA